MPAEPLDLKQEIALAWAEGQTVAANVFTEETLADEDVPAYYQVAEDIYQDASAVTVYVYVNEAEEVLFRVYGTVADEDDPTAQTPGFYACNSGGELLSFTVLKQSEEEKQAYKMFTFAEPAGDVPEYYEESVIATGENRSEALYVYKKNDGKTYYRVYGFLNDGEEGFYASDAEGNLLKPYEILSQLEEENNAFVGIIEAKIEKDLRPNEAYISNFEITQKVDGTAIWDNDDDAGNDSGPSNKIVRTFDSVMYTLDYTTSLLPQDETTYFKEGDMYIRFVIPDVDKTQATFDLDAMAWVIDGVITEENGDVINRKAAYYRRNKGQCDSRNGRIVSDCNCAGNEKRRSD